MPTGAPTLREVDAHIASKARTFRFPPRIEAAYELQSRSYLGRRMRTTVLPTVLVYNAFLPANYFLLPGTFGLAVFLHLAIVTPLIVAAGFVFRREPSVLVREFLTIAIPVAMVAQILLIYLLNAGPATEHYQYLAIMILVFMNVNQRPDVRFAAGASVMMIAMYAGALLLAGAPSAVLLVGIGSIVAATHLTLVANWRMERDARHVFLRRLQDRLRREGAEFAAGRDDLTGLANRRSFEARAAELWLMAGSTVQMAVIMIDVDHFKLFNDRHGHPAGDRCLKHVAGAIASELRGDDLPVRYGGEEFLVLLPDTDLPQAAAFAEKIRAAIERLGLPHEAVGSTALVTASLGVVAGPASAHSVAELVAGADTALYAAKRNGRNQVWPPLPAAPRTVVSLDSRRSARSA